VVKPSFGAELTFFASQATVGIVMISEIICVGVSLAQCLQYVHRSLTSKAPLTFASLHNSYGFSQDRDLPTLLLILPLDSVPPAVSGTTALIVQLYLSRRASGVRRLCSFVQPSRERRADFRPSQLFIHRPIAQKAFRIVITVLCALTWCSSITVTALYAWIVAHDLGPFAGGELSSRDGSRLALLTNTNEQEATRFT
jgi:hypothetical protein